MIIFEPLQFITNINSSTLLRWI